jgi:2-amino-4-hydroxy-6-hydroxymethyldihydropteridine diphosphokinase
LSSVYLSLGSNVGDREARLREALQRIESVEVRLLRRSSTYETEPQDVRDQPWFLNLVVEGETKLTPLDLLARIQEIEQEMGRERIVPKGPRTIDIDILLYGNEVIDRPELQIPHPKLAERRFVLEPLAELEPNLEDPVTGRTVFEMLSAIENQTVKRRPTSGERG